MSKYSKLVSQLEGKIKTMCGVGTRLVKLFLNSLIKKGDERAYLYRQLLECEMDNINAKRYHNTFNYKYSDYYYSLKRNDIDKLISDLLESNPLNVTFGYQKSDVHNVKHIIYFDVPDCGQISFHTDIGPHLMRYIEPYSQKWDGQINSTLDKIERGILTNYKDDIRKKYPKQISEYEEYLLNKQKKAEEKKEKKILNRCKKALTKPQMILNYNVDILDKIINDEFGDKEFWLKAKFGILKRLWEKKLKQSAPYKNTDEQNEIMKKLCENKPNYQKILELFDNFAK